MTTKTIRMDDELSAQTTSKLKELGLSFNTYVILAAKQLIIQNRIPFSLELPSEKEELSEETRRAIITAEAKELGILPDDSLSFDNASDFLASLDEE